jgi:hypothetical protein
MINVAEIGKEEVRRIDRRKKCELKAFRQTKGKKRRKRERDKQFLGTYFQGDEGGGQGGHDLVCRNGRKCVCKERGV